MSERQPVTRESFEAGIRYEGLRESLGNEIARHIELMRTHGADSELGSRHRAAAIDLEHLLDRLVPANHELIDAVEVLLRVNAVDRDEISAA